MLHDSRGKGLRSGHFSSETCKKKKLNIKGDAKLDPSPQKQSRIRNSKNWKAAELSNLSNRCKKNTLLQKKRVLNS